MRADLSPLTAIAVNRTGPGGKKYWTIVFSIEIHFGLTEFKARLKWIHGVCFFPCILMFDAIMLIHPPGERKIVNIKSSSPFIENCLISHFSGPASIVYDEGGSTKLEAEDSQDEDEDVSLPQYVSSVTAVAPSRTRSASNTHTIQLPVEDSSTVGQDLGGAPTRSGHFTSEPASDRDPDSNIKSNISEKAQSSNSHPDHGNTGPSSFVKSPPLDPALATFENSSEPAVTVQPPDGFGAERERVTHSSLEGTICEPIAVPPSPPPTGSPTDHDAPPSIHPLSPSIPTPIVTPPTPSGTSKDALPTWKPGSPAPRWDTDPASGMYEDAEKQGPQNPYLHHPQVTGIVPLTPADKRDALMPAYKRLTSRSLSVDDRVSLVASIFSDSHKIEEITHLHGDGAQAVVDILDEVASRAFISEE